MKQKMIFLLAALFASNVIYGALTPNQPEFPSTAAAAQALYDAVQRNDEPAIENILGAESDLTSSKDSDEDQADRQLFVQKFEEMHRVGRDKDGSATLYVGVENWPFPIPLMQKNGAWHFDAQAGATEITMRRIGENELAAILTCHDFIAAERSYRASGDTADPQEDISPASLAAKAAKGITSSEPVLLHGYYFKVLAMPTVSKKAAGKFAVVAYPAEYRSSGLMTFVVTEKDTVYEKDLGPDSSAAANAIREFHKDSSWRDSGE